MENREHKWLIYLNEGQRPNYRRKSYRISDGVNSIGPFRSGLAEAIVMRTDDNTGWMGLLGIVIQFQTWDNWRPRG